MKRASDVFGKEQRREVEAAIAEVEARTSAEIVVVAATRSGRYDRAEDLFGIMVAMIVCFAAWYDFSDVVPDRFKDPNGEFFYHWACWLSRGGEPKAALKRLSVALDQEPSLARQALTDPDLESLRDDPMFRQLVGQ